MPLSILTSASTTNTNIPITLNLEAITNIDESLYLTLSLLLYRQSIYPKKLSNGYPSKLGKLQNKKIKKKNKKPNLLPR